MPVCCRLWGVTSLWRVFYPGTWYSNGYADGNQWFLLLPWTLILLWSFFNVKGIVHPKRKILSWITHPHVVPNPLRNINEDIFAEFWELSNPPTDRIVITTINVQKRSKEISKIIHVSSGVQPSFYTATRILFIHKEITTNKITTLFNNCHPIVPFWRVSTEHKQHILFCVRWTRRISCFRLNQSVTLIVVITLLSMEGKRALRIHQKYLNLCSEDERRSNGLGTIWGWVIHDII